MRRRRTVLVLLTLLVVAAVALFVWRPWESGEAPPAPNPSDSAPVETTAGEPEQSPSPEPSESQPFTPIGGNPSAEAGEPCSAEQIRLTPQTDHTTYAADEPVQLSFTIENTGDAACSLNVGTSVQEYVVTTGDDVVYRWSDCATDEQDAVATLEPAAPQSTVPIEWDRTRSSTESCAGEGEQVTAGGAAYHLAVQVGEFSSAESRQFILE